MNRYGLMGKCLVTLMLVFCVSALQAQSLQTAEEQYKKGEIAAAVKIWEALANKGNAEAQYQLGTVYGKGTGVAENIFDAIEWYEMAAKQNHLLAQIVLGDIQYFSIGLLGNWGEALKWYEMAENQRRTGTREERSLTAKAAYRVASIYYERNHNFLPVRHSQQAKSHHADFVRAYGNNNKTLAYLRRALKYEENGGGPWSIRAKKMMFDMFSNSPSSHFYNPEEAFKLLSELIGKGYGKEPLEEEFLVSDVRKTFNLFNAMARLYEHGEGTPKRWDKAVEFYMLGYGFSSSFDHEAEKNLDGGLINIACMYYMGGFGLTRDTEKAQKIINLNNKGRSYKNTYSLRNC